MSIFYSQHVSYEGCFIKPFYKQLFYILQEWKMMNNKFKWRFLYSKTLTAFNFYISRCSNAKKKYIHEWHVCWFQYARCFGNNVINKPTDWVINLFMHILIVANVFFSLIWIFFLKMCINLVFVVNKIYTAVLKRDRVLKNCWKKGEYKSQTNGQK